MRRPDRVLHFAWTPALGGAVEPPAAEATAGWATGQRPAAQYLNALLNNLGSWAEFLRGPSLSRWTRVALPGTFDTAKPIVLAADRTTVEGSAVPRRLVAAGTDGTGQCVYVSRRGEDWTRHANFPVGTAGDFSRAYFHAGYWYLVVDNTTDGRVLTSPADTVTGSALDGSPDWDYLSITDGGPVAMAFADATGVYYQVTVTSTDIVVAGNVAPDPTGGTAVVVGGTAPVGAYTDVAFDGTSFIAVTASGYVATATSAGGAVFTGLAGRITLETGIDWRLSVGADGEVIAWRWGEAVTAQHYFRSTDHGVSWVEVSPVTGPGLVTSLSYDAGGWVATSTVAPYVWSSNDLATWTKLKPPMLDGDNPSAYGAVLSEGAWIVMRPATALAGDRAEDDSDGAWSVDPTPTTLGNAGWLAGYRINLTAPTDGQVLAWDAGTSRYVPTTPSTGAAYTVRSKTTTYTALAGDVLVCDATGGAFTVTLPAAAAVSGASISVKKTDASANAVTVDGNGSETIDGAATLALSTQYEAVTLWSDGTSWWVF